MGIVQHIKNKYIYIYISKYRNRGLAVTDRAECARACLPPLEICRRA